MTIGYTIRMLGTQLDVAITLMVCIFSALRVVRWMAYICITINSRETGEHAQPALYLMREAGLVQPAHMKNFGYWNNVHILSGSLGTTTEVNTNGSVDIASGDSGTQQIYNNTFIGPNNSDNTLCLGLENLSGVSYENNTFTNCGDPVNISNTKVVAADYNLYGTQCGNGNNCFIWNGAFTGSFAAWKASCNCDSHALQNNNPLLNADGSPQSGSPVIQQGANLMNIGTVTLVHSSKIPATVIFGLRSRGPVVRARIVGQQLVGMWEPISTELRIRRTRPAVSKRPCSNSIDELCESLTAGSETWFRGPRFCNFD